MVRKSFHKCSPLALPHQVEQPYAETEFDTTSLKSTVPRMEQKIMSCEENEENPSFCNEKGYSDLLPM
jgi:hypothetical protein